MSISMFHKLDLGLDKIPMRERTPRDRYRIGKNLRMQSPREDHHILKTNGRDPLPLFMATDPHRLRSLLPLRYERMSASPFAFYRGCASLMAHDLSLSASTPYIVQVCGDAHLMNFGGFATAERNIVFDLNDFDETAAAPFEWDLKRLVTSFVIAGQHLGYKQEKCEILVATVVDHYRDMLCKMSTQTNLENWYHNIDFQQLIHSSDDKKLQQMEMKAIKEAMSRDQNYEFSRMAQDFGEGPKLVDNYPFVFHPDTTIHPDLHGAVLRTFGRYKKSLSLERQVLLDRYDIQDSALKVVGVGSVGMFCGMILLMAGEDDVLLLQLKEVHKSVLEDYRDMMKFKTHGARVVFGQKLMQSSYDILLGHFIGESGRHYYVRQLRDIKVKIDIEKYKFKHMVIYAQRCAWALARAHARSGDPAIMAGYIGRGQKFREALTEFGFNYAQQNLDDYNALLKGIESGRVPITEKMPIDLVGEKKGKKR